MCVTTIALLLLSYTTFLKDSTASWIGWVILVCSCILGLAGGFLLYKCQRLGAAILAGWGGFMAGILINTTFAFAMHGSVVFWIITISCSIVAGLVALCAYNPVVIIMTSFAGSYIFVRGISLYTGGYTSELVIMQMIKNGQISKIDPIFYAWLSGIVVCTIISCCVQFRRHKADELKRAEEDAEKSH